MMKHAIEHENIAFLCPNCEKTTNVTLEAITHASWEEHHSDFTKSLLNPKKQYQGMFIIRSDISNLGFKDIKRICLPEGWFLIGEDILRIRINNKECNYYKCPKVQRYIIDLPDKTMNMDDSLFLIVDFQDTMENKIHSFKRFLSGLGCSEQALENIEIDHEKLERCFIKKKGIKTKSFSFTMLNASSPFEEIEMIDYWIKLPIICKFSNNTKYYSSKKLDFIDKKIDFNYIDAIEDEKTLKGVIKKGYDGIEDNIKKIKDKKKEYAKYIKKYKELCYTPLGRPIYQLSQEDTKIYHFKKKNLLRNENVAWQAEIKFKREALLLYFFPLIFSLFHITLSFFYLVFPHQLKLWIPSFNSWVFLSLSLNISIWLLIALNWSLIRHLRLFQPKVFSRYFIFLISSFSFAMVSLILSPIIHQFTI